MEKIKKTSKAWLALAIGIAGGFACLIGIFSTLGSDLETSEVLTWVAFCTSLFLVFIVTANQSKSKSCNSSTLKS